MSDDPRSDDPPRPLPPRALVERVRSWLAWFGLARLVTGAAAVLVVVLGSIWLLRAPPPATEAALPMVSTTATSVAGPSVPAATAAPGPAPSAVHVHVAGAVVRPGVHELAAGARVVDAVAAAGGSVAGADLDALNLAAVLADGQRVYVPVEGEVVELVDPGAGATETVATGPIDLNVASAGDLDALPGIGPTTAAAIVRHRDEHGPFMTVDGLLDVRGIGPAKLDAIRALVTT
jgi:competence protein ComEA